MDISNQILLLKADAGRLYTSKQYPQAEEQYTDALRLCERHALPDMLQLLYSNR